MGDNSIGKVGHNEQPQRTEQSQSTSAPLIERPKSRSIITEQRTQTHQSATEVPSSISSRATQSLQKTGNNVSSNANPVLDTIFDELSPSQMSDIERHVPKRNRSVVITSNDREIKSIVTDIKSKILNSSSRFSVVPKLLSAIDGNDQHMKDSFRTFLTNSTGSDNKLEAFLAIKNLLNQGNYPNIRQLSDLKETDNMKSINKESVSSFSSKIQSGDLLEALNSLKKVSLSLRQDLSQAFTNFQKTDEYKSAFMGTLINEINQELPGLGIGTSENTVTDIVKINNAINQVEGGHDELINKLNELKQMLIETEIPLEAFDSADNLQEFIGSFKEQTQGKKFNVVLKALENHLQLLQHGASPEELANSLESISDKAFQFADANPTSKKAELSRHLSDITLVKAQYVTDSDEKIEDFDKGTIEYSMSNIKDNFTSKSEFDLADIAYNPENTDYCVGLTKQFNKEFATENLRGLIQINSFFKSTPSPNITQLNDLYQKVYHTQARDLAQLPPHLTKNSERSLLLETVNLSFDCRNKFETAVTNNDLRTAMEAMLDITKELNRNMGDPLTNFKTSLEFDFIKLRRLDPSLGIHNEPVNKKLTYGSKLTRNFEELSHDITSYTNLQKLNHALKVIDNSGDRGLLVLRAKLEDAKSELIGEMIPNDILDSPSNLFNFRLGNRATLPDGKKIVKNRFMEMTKGTNFNPVLAALKSHQDTLDKNPGNEHESLINLRNALNTFIDYSDNSPEPSKKIDLAKRIRKLVNDKLRD